MKKFFKVSFFLGILTAIYSIIYLPRTLNIKKVDYDIQGNSNFTVVQLSDIHISIFNSEKRLKKIVKKVNQLDADIIVFTGDLYDRDWFFGGMGSVSLYLNKLKSKYGKFAIYGNHDYAGEGSKIFKKTIEDGGFTLLVNSGYNIQLDEGKTVFVGGSDDFLLGNPSIKDTMSSQSQHSNYNLVLTHEPDPADYFAKENVDLILAGHSHNGQVKLPFYRFYNNLGKKYVYGLFEIENNTKVFVSSGIGCSWMPIRFGVAPEIVVHNISIN